MTDMNTEQTVLQLRETMSLNLSEFERIPIDDAALRSAAVAIVVVESLDDHRQHDFLLTRRGGTMRRHRGQWALPGGRADEGENAQQTARRELAEELGLSVGGEQVLGLLDDYPTRSGFCVTPVVIWGGRVETLQPDPDEVAAVYRVPLSDLEHPEIPTLERIPQSDRPVLSIPVASIEQTVFAPTAAMIYQFREVALHARHTRVAEYEQPVFAWK
ncbi:MAG: 8-oxo-dGTP pyrophosphatase MutT (NUDIX family) [Gammaproteobacteria bacterium]|jgi:8-oxo-dGTP pyrophosphatase MutT (NUDIX family)